MDNEPLFSPLSSPEAPSTLRATIYHEQVPYSPELAVARYHYAVPKNPDFNCFGFGFYVVGLLPDERYIDPDIANGDIIPHHLKHVCDAYNLSGGRVSQPDAQVVAVADASDPTNYLHLAVIDPENPGFVMHRPDHGKQKCRHLGQTAFKNIEAHNSHLLYAFFKRK